MKTMKTFLLGDQLYGFSASSWSQAMIFRDEGVTLDEHEVVDDGILFCSPILPLSAASALSMPDTIRGNLLEDAILSDVNWLRSGIEVSDS